jgi:hypothetical protein
MAMRTWIKVLLIVAVVAIVLSGGIYSFYLWHRYEYPYGASHCCDLGLEFALGDYARTHGGRYPAGEATPEASLSLLYRAGMEDANGLRGKTVPESVVREILESGGLLGPDTCGWHYVEGLTLADDPRLALFWDKEGLGHNGQRMRNGDHFVTLIGSGRTVIPGDKWAEFLEEQKKLLATRSKAAIEAIPMLAAKVRLPSGEIVDHFEAPFELDVRLVSKLDYGPEYGSRRWTRLDPQFLCWWKSDELGTGSRAQRTLALSLTLGQWRSKPVEIKLSNGVAAPTSFVFEMSESKTDPR